MSRMELRLAGSGGQGVILATVILAEAAVIAGKQTAQSQSYGPEARGGSCKAEVIISDEKIGFTKVQNPTFLMVLTQKAWDAYGGSLQEGCLVLADESVELAGAEGRGLNTVTLPILRTAKEKTGKAFTANIVAIGAINGLLKLVDHEHLKEAVFRHIPKGTEAINEKALEAGIELVEGAAAQ